MFRIAADDLKRPARHDEIRGASRSARTQHSLGDAMESTMPRLSGQHGTALSRDGAGRLAVAVLMPIGPLAIAILRAILPYDTTDSNTVMAAKVAAHQGAESAVIWLTFAALLTLIPGVIALGLLARRHAPRLGTTGLIVTFAAFMCLFWSSVSGVDTVALGALRMGLHPAAVGALNNSIGSITPIGIAANIFPIGHILGLILLAVALWRGRVIPGWAAVLLGGSQVLHLVFAVIVPIHALDGCAWLLTAVGFAIAARALVREGEPEQA
jgi:hypothetical protein